MNCFHWKKYLAAVVAASLPLLATATPLRILPLTVSGYTGTEALADFPVLVRLSEQIEGFSYADCRPDGADVTFALEDGTPLSREIDTWNPEGESLIWVRLPSLQNGTAFQCRYDDADATTQPACQTDGSVWKPSGYIGVWHMNDLAAKDSTGLGNDGVPTRAGGESSNGIVAGKVGAAQDFDGATKLDCGTGLDPAFAASMTVEGWLRPSDIKGYHGMLGKDKCFSPKFSDGTYIFTTPGVSDHRFTPRLTVGVWSHVAFTFLPSTPQGAKAYENGNLKESKSASRMNAPAPSSRFYLGGNQWAGEFFKGVLDEIRISKVIRSADWLGATHGTMASPAFLTAGHVLYVGDDGFLISGAPSEFGTATPSYGLHREFAAGTTIPCSAPGAVTNEAAGEIGICSGWRVLDRDGNLLSSGTGKSCAIPKGDRFTHLVWIFSTSYRVTATGEKGTVSGFAPWAPAGSTQSFLAEPSDPTFSFRHWEGDVPSGKEEENPLSLVVEGPLSLRAVFTPRQTRKWTGAGTDALASNGANWEGGAAPVSGDDILLDATGTARPMTWDLDIPVNTWTQDGYENVVTIATRYGAEGFTNLVITGDCLLKSGSWTHLDNSTAQTYRLRVTIGGAMTIGPEASLDANTLGFDPNCRPDGEKVPGYTAGTHAGNGGSAIREVYEANSIYGSIPRPESLGAGGTWSSGGGAIYLDVGGALSLEGSITADSAKDRYYTGAGGSVLVIAGSIGGEGTLSASAHLATTDAGATGGGGRVAVVLRDDGADFARYDILRLAKADSAGAACGTIYAETAADTPRHGWLIMKGNGKLIPEKLKRMRIFSEECPEIDFTRITLTNAASIRLAAGDRLRLDRIALDVSNSRVIKENGFILDGGEVVLSRSGEVGIGCTLDFRSGKVTQCPVLRFQEKGMLAVRGEMDYVGDLVFDDGAEAILSRPLHVDGNVVFRSGSSATHDGPSKNGPGDRIEVEVSGDMTVEEGARVSSCGKGYSAPLGGPVGNRSVGNQGASHGGVALPGYSGTINTPYGSIYRPDAYGAAGASGHGGGLVRLSIAGTLHVDGKVDSDGGMAKDHYSGAGGSLDIQAGFLAGTGSISADSGVMHTPWGPSGGGRVAVHLTDPAATFDGFQGTIHAYGGHHSDRPDECGGAGTVYLRTASQGLEEGSLVIDNVDGRGKTATTPLGGAVEGTAFGDVIIRGSSEALLLENEVLRVSGLFTNGASFLASPGSVVKFTGAGDSLIAGDSVFWGLQTATPGKKIAFAAGSTQSVTGVLSIAGSPENHAALVSSVPGEPWSLDLSGHGNVIDADVSDSDASPGKTVAAVDGSDLGGNSNWIFPASSGSEIVWTGACDSSWENGDNWSSGYAPGQSDRVRVAVAPHLPRLGLDTMVEALAIAPGASLELAGHDLTVSGNLSAGGTIVASASETIRVGGDLHTASLVPAQSTFVLGGSSAQTVSSSETVFSTIVVEGPEARFASSFTAARLIAITAGTPKTLAFAPSAAIRVHELKLNGKTAAPDLRLASTSPGTRWGLSAAGYDVRGVRVSDCDASAGVTVFPLDSIDGGNNINWAFSDNRKHWTGSVDGDFSNGANWADGTVPTEEDDLFLAGPTTVTLSERRAVGSLTVGSGAIVEIKTNLSVIGSVTVEDGGTIVWDKPGEIGGNLVLRNGARMTHSPCGPTEANKIDLRIAGDGYIAPGAAIDVTSKGHAKQSGPGFNGNTGSSHGGRGRVGTVPVGPCYGSIVSPTNCGSGGNWGNTPGGGAVRLSFDGDLVLEGSIVATGEDDNQQHYNGTGGSIDLSVGRLLGGGSLEANGGRYYKSNAGSLSGGGRIAVKLHDPLASRSDFSGVFEVYPGRNPDDKPFASVGTLYLEEAHEKGGRGRVFVDRQIDRDANPLTDFPSMLLCEEKETLRTSVHVGDWAVLNLTRDTTVEDIELEGGNALLRLNGHTLTVRSKKHALGENELKQVTYDDGGQVLWVPRGGPTLLLIR